MSTFLIRLVSGLSMCSFFGYLEVSNRDKLKGRNHKDLLALELGELETARTHRELNDISL